MGEFLILPFFIKTSLNFSPILVSVIQIPYNILVLLSLKTGNGLRAAVIGKGCWPKTGLISEKGE